MSPAEIAWLLSWAVFYTGYPMPDEAPVIEWVPHSFFVHRICSDIDTEENPCVVRAMYDDNIDAFIFIDDVWEDNITGSVKSIIVHEMVHYLQDLSGEWEGIEDWPQDVRCFERMFRQREAYMAQDKYVLDIHNRKRLLRRKYDPCGNK